MKEIAIALFLATLAIGITASIRKGRKEREEFEPMNNREDQSNNYFV